MTYKELKDRLSKCEFALKTIKDGTHKDINSLDIKQTTEKLNILKESLIKQLNTLEEANSKTYLVTPKSGQTTAVSMSDDETDALKDADDVKAIKGIDGEEIKENVQFSIDETKAIAKKVGEAVAKSLKSLGDDVGSMKAKNIEPNSFEIYVQYKSGKDDEFSFLISKDKLVLQDFSFNKDLVSVGVKPSGEPIIQVDVLANELVKHFKSLNEVEEGAYQTTYIKVARSDYKKAMAVLDQNLDPTYVKTDIVDDDGDGNVIIYFNFRAKDDGEPGEDVGAFIYDASMDLQSQGIPVVDASHDLDEIKETEGEKDMNEPDIDVGHVDDEPDMLQNTAYETTQYAAKLVKKLQKYNQHDGEVDFPNWWQSKLILAREYISSAYHYLDSKEKQPALDKLALEENEIGDSGKDVGMGYENARDMIGYFREKIYPHMNDQELEEFRQVMSDHLKDAVAENVDKVAGGIPYKREGNKFIISEPLDDATKERIIGRAKEHGHHAAPNQAGGVTIMAKEGKKIKLSKGDPTNMAYTDKVNEGRGVMDSIKDAVEELMFDGDISEKEAAMELVIAISDQYGFDLAGHEFDIFHKGMSEKNEGFNQVQAQYDDLTQVVKNIAHVGEMSTHDAAYNAVGHIEDEFGIDLSEPDQNIHEDSIDKIQKGLEVVKRHIKTHLEMYKDAESPKNKQLAVNMLKKLNAQKKQLEKHLEDKVSGIGRDQELDIDEAGPGFKHDCAAKVVHEKYGAGNTIPEKHTLVKEGNKYVVTHYDVLFENGNTVLDIPVEELKIETTNEHWHKGYKKKKK